MDGAGRAGAGHRLGGRRARGRLGAAHGPGPGAPPVGGDGPGGPRRRPDRPRPRCLRRRDRSPHGPRSAPRHRRAAARRLAGTDRQRRGRALAARRAPRPAVACARTAPDAPPYRRSGPGRRRVDRTVTGRPGRVGPRSSHHVPLDVGRHRAAARGRGGTRGRLAGPAPPARGAARPAGRPRPGGMVRGGTGRGVPRHPGGGAARPLGGPRGRAAHPVPAAPGERGADRHPVAAARRGDRGRTGGGGARLRVHRPPLDHRAAGRGRPSRRAGAGRHHLAALGPRPARHRLPVLRTRGAAGVPARRGPGGVLPHLHPARPTASPRSLTGPGLRSC